MTMTQRPDDLQLSAWLDGELDPAAQAEVDAWLRDHPEDAALTRLWAADRDALRARFDPVQDEPIPPALLQTVQHYGRVAVRPLWLRAAMAAGLLVGGGLIGGLIGATTAARDPAAFAALPLPWHDGAQVVATGWPQRAAIAHAVYVPEVRHPVEVNVAEGSASEQRAQEQRLAKWLSKRLDLPVHLYDLRPQGFELVGGRLLPDSTGPSAQLMYQNGAGQRITLYLRKPEGGADTSFRFQRDGELNLFYWIEDGFGCALVGKLPREQLLVLAEAVYKQAEAAGIQPAPPRPGS
jgi:anti-sigma factor RsiW